MFLRACNVYWVNLMLYKSILVDQLKMLGLKSGDLIMLHASMRAIGQILGGPDQVHQAIMECIQPAGTLMMYLGTEGEQVYYALARGDFSAREETEILAYCPIFDRYSARARRSHGILAEFFRTWPGTMCSDNPGARMAAMGAKADWLVANHPLNYGYGPGSPLAKLYENNGKILLLGSDLDQVTILHYAEHIAPIKNKRLSHFKAPFLKDGQRVWCEVEEFDTSTGIRQWPDRFFATILEKYIQENDIKSAKIGNALSYLISAKSLVDFAIPIFVQAANKYQLGST
jgi:aminoglycoside 3-N-acetyltransferase